MRKVTKADIENMAKEIMNVLTEHECDRDVFIYYNNKRMHHAIEWSEDYKKIIDNGILIEEDIDPHDYFDYAAYDHIFSMSFEGALYDYFNYEDCPSWLEKIFDKYGVYYELGNSWNLTVYPISDDIKYEYTIYEKPKETIYLTHWKIQDGIFPSEMKGLLDTWETLANEYGVNGSCIIGDGIYFEWNNERYFFSTNYNQSDVVSKVIDGCKEYLVSIGATEIWYDCGRMD